jgi:pimeloyl-ACP methyl ester carboxylesterase
MIKPRRHGEDLRGATRLAAEATRGVMELVETMHRTIAAGPPLLGRPLARPAELFTKVAYAPMREVTRWVAGGVDAALARLEPLLGESVPGKEREAVVAALNGVLGDYLEETGNPLATPMTLHYDDARRAVPGALHDGKLLLAIHGSSMNRHAWSSTRTVDGSVHDHAADLARDLGYVPVYLEYNSGRHISTNGAELADKLEELVRDWPEPVTEIVLLAHSMGGLVARSACARAESRQLGWRRQLRALVCLGSPHHGAPLERGGNWVDALLGWHPYSAPLARLGKIRSAGVTDMRFGAITDEHWKGRDRFARGRDTRTPVPLPAGVACYAVAATLSPAGSPARLRGDGLVPVDSAFGIHPREGLTLRFPEQHRWLVREADHLELLGRADVYAKLHAWLGGKGVHGTES